MGDLDIETKSVPTTGLSTVNTEIKDLKELKVGSGSSIFYTDKEGSRWGHSTFDEAKAWVKVDGTAQFKTAAGQILLSSDATDGNFINIINTALNTSSKTILQGFTFGSSNYAGAFKTGNITWNEATGAITGGSGSVYNKAGLIFANAGVPTITLNGVTGAATFAGTLSAPNGTLGTITSGTISGANIYGGNIYASSSASTGNVHLYVGAYGGQCDIEYGGQQKGFYAASSTTVIFGSANGANMNIQSVGSMYRSANSWIVDVYNDDGGEDTWTVQDNDTVRLEMNGSGDFWIDNNCSAQSFTDRTPHYTGNAVEELRGVKGKKVKGKDEIDHSSLPSFMRRTKRTPDFRDKATGEVLREGTVIEERDLGAAISMLIKAIQEVDERLDKIEKATR